MSAAVCGAGNVTLTVAAGVRGVDAAPCTKLMPVDPVLALLEPPVVWAELLAAETVAEYPHPETMRIRRRQQANRTMALPHQPLYPVRCAPVLARVKSAFQRSLLSERRSTTSESDGGGTQIRDTNFTSVNKISFQGQIKMSKGNKQVTFGALYTCSPYTIDKSGCSGHPSALADC